MRSLCLLVVATIFAEFVAGEIIRNSSHYDQWEFQDTVPGYSNEWVIRTSVGPEQARILAEDMGYYFKGEVFGLQGVYRLEMVQHPQRHKREAAHLTTKLIQDDRVLWGEQQRILIRTKRDFMDGNEIMDEDAEVGPPLKRSKRPSLSVPEEPIDMHLSDQETFRSRRGWLDTFLNTIMSSVYPDQMSTYRGSNSVSYFYATRAARFNDDLWGKQWYLNKDVGNGPPGHGLLDMNVMPCYDLGYSGKGIKVSILDDGIEGSHYDLRDNYEPSISYDMNDNDPDPTPKYNDENSHGTRCAGEVAMVANNRKCGVGVAFNARIGGIRMLDGIVTDGLEAGSVGYNFQDVDVYSASWGPTDDGKTVDGPGPLLQEAFLKGVTQGRQGNGIIYVWAAGNGGVKGDSCSCDGYVNSIYTLTVSSVTQSGRFPWYAEQCAATLTTTYSSGRMGEGMIVTTDLNNQCTNKHSGTSAAAPIAAGIVALLLEARPDLTWRDVQHIVVQTSRPEALLGVEGWQRNGAGLYANTRFGFGLMDAHAMVLAARTWVKVPPSRNCATQFQISNNGIKPMKLFAFELPMECADVQYLEHVEIVLNLKAQIRGALEVYLTSPMGTRVQLLQTRRHDKSREGFVDWKFMSVLTWNENPNGKWLLQVLDNCFYCGKGSIGNPKLTVHGTKEKPAYINEYPSPEKFNLGVAEQVKEYKAFSINNFTEGWWKAFESFPYSINIEHGSSLHEPEH